MNCQKEKMKELMNQVKEIKIGYAQKWLDALKTYDRICIFGTGSHGHNWYGILKKYDIKVDCFYDNDQSKWNQEIMDGIICFPWEEPEKNTAVVIAIREYEAVYRQVQTYMKESNIFIGTINTISFMANYDYLAKGRELNDVYQKMLQVMELCQDDMSREICCQTFRKWFIDEKSPITYNGESYFFTEEIMLSDKECLVDAGAFDGDTIRSFKKATDDQYETIYAFEMDKRNYNNLQRYCFGTGGGYKQDDSRINLYQMGVSDCKGTFCYNSNFETTQFAENGNEICEVDSLDCILRDKKVTFIKMDIEGSEMQALHGAEVLIKNQKPKLAICIYHSIEDFLNIPVYIKNLNPEYKILIRHHSICEAETVCYAYLE